MNAKISHHNGQTFIEIDGEKINPIAWRSFRPKKDVIDDFYRYGYRLFNVFPSGIRSRLRPDRSAGYSDFGAIWVGENEYCWENLQKQVDLFADTEPDGYVMLMAHLDTPDWFLKAHPECRDSYSNLAEMCANELWKTSAASYIRALIDKIDEMMPNRVYCVAILAGGTTEWYTENTGQIISDPSETYKRAFFQKSGKQIPPKEALLHTSDGIFASPTQDANSVEYWRFHNKIVADAICYFARVIKEKTNNQKLVGLFYGYLLAVHFPAVTALSYNSLTQVLSSPYIDVLFSPTSYRLRDLQFNGAFRLPIDSVTANKKLYFHELDERSHVAADDGYPNFKPRTPPAKLSRFRERFTAVKLR